jgi:hypothetical protein
MIVRWSCRGLRSKLPEFQQWSQNVDVIILSETWFGKAESVYLKGFDVVRKVRNERAGGGVGLFINKKLKYSRKDGLYDGNGKTEACAIELYTAQDKLLIVPCYKQLYMSIELWAWNKFFAQFKGKFLIGGVFDGHHYSCSNSKTYTAGNNLFNCITKLATNIALLCDGSICHHRIHGCPRPNFCGSKICTALYLLHTWMAETGPWDSIEYNGIMQKCF